jgi:predicted nuclease of predicted toxin-antitoxin system
MKFKIDENLPSELKDDLTSAGQNAETVHDEAMTGAVDALLIEAARQEQRVLLTMDKGIADVRAYPPENYAGIVLFRPKSQGRQATLEFVRSHLPSILGSKLSGHLIVISDSGIRIR